MKSLQAAAEFVGGEKQPAGPLGIAQPSLGRLIADLHHASDPLLIWAVDIVLAHRQSLIPLAATWTFGLGGDSGVSR